MGIATSKDMAQHLCDELGIESKGIKSMSLELKPNTVATLVVERFVHEDELWAVLERYGLTLFKP